MNTSILRIFKPSYCIVGGIVVCLILYALHPPINKTDMLLEAIRNNNVDSVRTLLRSGASAKVKGRSKSNDDDSRGIVLLLINSLTGWYGIEENAKDTMPVLLVATETENTQIVALLLDYGADINSFYGAIWFNALFIATMHDDAQMVELLLKRGIDYHHKQSNGDDVFVWASSPEVKKVLYQYIKK